MARKQRWKTYAHLTTPDSIFHVATRYRGAVVIGGQVGHVNTDEALWANENYPGSIHEHLPYWGFWHGGAYVPRTSAGALRVDGMTLEGGEEGVARIAAGAAGTLRWDVLFPDSNAAWEVIIANASTGAVVSAGPASGTNYALPALAAGSYLVRVRVSNAARTYGGLPADYPAVSGQSSTYPPNNAWIHPALGLVFYDPTWDVGALPYNPGDALQAALLDRRAEAVATGTARKNPAWADSLFVFDSEGAPLSGAGEWSMLRLVAGSGEWVGDAAVHPAATAGPARWTAGETLTPVPAGIDPRARSVGAFFQETVDGADVLWEGAMIAGRSGRTVALYKHVDGVLQQTSLGTTVSAQRWCECALSTEQVTAIARAPHDGTLYLTTFCDRFSLDTATNELVSAHPGGRSLVASRGADGGAVVGYATESDFANSGLHKRGFNYLLMRDSRAGGFTVGPGTAHHVAACVVGHGGALYGIEETGNATGWFGGEVTPEALRRQYVSRFSGGTWQRVTGALSHGWSVAEYDVGPGARSRGGVNFFGEDVLGNPTAVRYQGATLEKNISGEYHPRNPQTVLAADGKAENILTPARRRNEDGSLEAGWFVVETSGLAAKLLFIYAPECGGSGCFCIPLSALVEAGVDPGELPTCLQWTGDCWQAGACSGNYLELVIDEEAGTACYHVHGTLPYDPEVLDGLEWMDGRACIVPVPAVANAREALDRMPVGTTVHCHRVRAAEGGLISAIQIAGTRDEDTIEAEYPQWCWMGDQPLPDERGDAVSTAMNAALETFTTKARLDRTLWLELPRAEVYVCYLIPPLRHIAPVSKAVF